MWIYDSKDGRHLFSLWCHELIGPREGNMAQHHELELSCVLEGEGTYLVEGHSYDLRKGDVMLLPNTDRHFLHLSAEQSLTNLVIHFDPAFIWNSLAGDLDYRFLSIFFERGPHFSHRLDRDNPVTSEIFRIICEMRDEMERADDCHELMVKIKLQTVLVSIIRNYNYLAENSVLSLAEHDIRRLDEVGAYIENHLSEEIRLSQLAAIMHVSPTYFSSLFKRYYGIPPIEYIINKRVRRAIELIRTTNRSLTDIAMTCGFNNSTNFYKAFRRVTGRTPIVYRNDPNEARRLPAQSEDSL